MQSYWAESALLATGWSSDVRVTVDDQGVISDVEQGVPATDAENLNGVLLPGITNLHSHAHQRAMAGLGEQAGVNESGERDSFWTWRKIMYHYLERI